ncbi:MAG: hypothetical protein NHB32_08665 [Fischerella sp. CENA71]|nr:hypothetical protein [Fischerella sp. CENA71]
MKIINRIYQITTKNGHERQTILFKIIELAMAVATETQKRVLKKFSHYPLTLQQDGDFTMGLVN